MFSRTHKILFPITFSAAAVLVMSLAIPPLEEAPPAQASVGGVSVDFKEIQLETQSFTVPSDVKIPKLERGTYTSITAAQVRQEAVINKQVSMSGPALASVASNQIHDPNDGTVFYPLYSWGYSYLDNGFRTSDRPSHNGMDFQAPEDTEIFAIAKGTVIAAGWGGDYGNYVVLSHVINGVDVESLYAHMVRTPPVTVGQTVDAFEIIGHVGTTGRSTGNHLHLEIRVNGALQDPASWLQVNALG